jgi:hypothetical protein
LLFQKANRHCVTQILILRFCAGFVLFVLVAGESYSTAFVTNVHLPLRYSRCRSACSSSRRPETLVGLKMGYLDNLDSGNKNMQGKDKDGKQVMPGFEEFMEVGSHLIFDR